VCVFLTVLGPCDDDGQLRMEADAGDVLSMAFQGLDTRLVLKDTQEKWCYYHIPYILLIYTVGQGEMASPTW